jgi:hypothetical protein
MQETTRTVYNREEWLKKRIRKHRFRQTVVLAFEIAFVGTGAYLILSNLGVF